MDYLQLSERVKFVQSTLKIHEIVSKYVTLRKDGEFYFGRCPFHKDEGESLAVNPSAGKFYCYTCHAGGNALNFMARMQNISLAEAADIQAKNSNFELYPTKINFDEERAARNNRELTEINDYARDFYHEILMNADEGDTCRKYLESRGITKREIEKFQLGFAPNHEKILMTFLDEYDFKFYTMIQSGLVEGNDEGFSDKFRDCITIPISDKLGTIALIGQVFDFDKKVFYESDGIASKYVYPKENSIFNKHKLIFGFQESYVSIVKSNSVIVVEDCFDAIYLMSAGVENVVSVFDKTLTEEQAEILSTPAKRIIFCLKHGDSLQIEEEVITSVAQDDGKIFVAALDKSPCDFFKANGSEIFYKSLENSVPFDDYEFSKRRYETEVTALATQNNLPEIQTINNLQAVRGACEAVLKIACRDSDVFKYAIQVIPQNLFSELQQEFIEYLTICLNENSRPSKEGASIFFDGNVDEKFLRMLENTQPLTDKERLAFEDGVEFLLKKTRQNNYTKTTIKMLQEKKFDDESFKKLIKI